MIPIPEALDSATLFEGLIAFHEKTLWLGLKFPMYPFIKKLFIRTQLMPIQLIGWRYLICLTLTYRGGVGKYPSLMMHIC